MILKGSQRAGAKQLAVHLLRTDENEHVEIHDIRGFAADDLTGALREAYAVSRGTRCKQFLFSLSLSPPETESVPIEAFEAAIGEIEAKLGLSGQPRAIVFHEKQGRRHAHCVWSRIDPEKMTAINLPHFKLKLRDVSRQLYIEHGWRMPHGLMDSAERDPRNFTRAEWQQVKRSKQDPRELKTIFQDCWAISDSCKALDQALASRGFYLARGDRRTIVAVDLQGQIYAVAKWAAVRTNAVTAKLGNGHDLPSVVETKARIAELMTGVLKRHLDEADATFQARWKPLKTKRTLLIRSHRAVRAALDAIQEARRVDETRKRAKRLPRGLRAVWGWLTGMTAAIRRQNETEAAATVQRDGAERQSLIEAQLEDGRRLQAEIRQVRQAHARETAHIHRDLTELRPGSNGEFLVHDPAIGTRPRRWHEPSM